MASQLEVRTCELFLLHSGMVAALVLSSNQSTVTYDCISPVMSEALDNLRHLNISALSFSLLARGDTHVPILPEYSSHLITVLWLPLSSALTLLTAQRNCIDEDRKLHQTVVV